MKDRQVQGEINKATHTEHQLLQTQDKLKKTELKLRQIQQTKLKDLQRTIKQKEQTISELNKKIADLLENASSKRKDGSVSASRVLSGSRQQALRNKSVRRGRDLQSRSKERLHNDLSKLSDGSFLRKSPSNYRVENSIKEVEENFEASGNNFGGKLSPRGPFYAPDAVDDWNGSHLAVSLPELEAAAYRKNMTPQRLPAIKAPLLRANVGIDYNSIENLGTSTNRFNRNTRRVSEPLNVHPSWNQNRYTGNLPSAKSQYNQKLDSYNQQLQSPRFFNNSNRMGNLLGGSDGEDKNNLSKQE